MLSKGYSLLILLHFLYLFKNSWIIQSDYEYKNKTQSINSITSIKYLPVEGTWTAGRDDEKKRN